MDFSSPMAKAILSMCHNLEERLRALKVPSGTVKAFIFGGSAVHLYTRSRTSSDLDMEIESFALTPSDLLFVREGLAPVDYEDPEHGPSTLVFDSNFNTTFGPLHADYQERAHLLVAAPDSPLVVYLPSPEDVATSKLGRLSDVDLEDILLLLNVPGASLDRFKKIATEAASYYVGNSKKLTENIKFVIDRYKRHGRESQ